MFVHTGCGGKVVLKDEIIRYTSLSSIYDGGYDIGDDPEDFYEKSYLYCNSCCNHIEQNEIENDADEN